VTSRETTPLWANVVPDSEPEEIEHEMIGDDEEPATPVPMQRKTNPDWSQTQPPVPRRKEPTAEPQPAAPWADTVPSPPGKLISEAAVAPAAAERVSSPPEEAVGWPDEPQLASAHEPEAEAEPGQPAAVPGRAPSSWPSSVERISPPTVQPVAESALPGGAETAAEPTPPGLAESAPAPGAPVSIVAAPPEGLPVARVAEERE